MPPGRVTWSRFRFSTMDPVCRRSSCPGCSASSPEPTLRAREARGAPASVCRSCVDWPRPTAVSYTHLRAHETRHDLVCRLLLEKKKTTTRQKEISTPYTTEKQPAEQIR